MYYIELLMLGIGLSADAFAVALCKGLATGKVTPKHMIIVGLWFGGFQGLMPVIGYYLGSYALSFIEGFDHWIAAGLLVLIGANMIREAFSGGENTDASFAPGKMLVLAIATSIDALAVGIAIAMSHEYGIGAAAVVIGCTTFILSAIGVRIGAVFGEKFRRPASIAGGTILIILGLKILFEHLGIISF